MTLVFTESRLLRRLLRFGDYTMDVRGRVLRANGESLAIEPKVFDCLAYLIENRVRAVGRDELIAAVWGKVDVSDAMLGQAILKARRVVRDAGHTQTTIRTVPRFGYQWIADVEELSTDDAPACDPVDAAADTSTPIKPRGLARSGYLVAAGLGFIAAALVLIWAALRF
jgi:DNA-binding winged helix-turn-helix (wHTH) protein